jgi:hypothetical protein
VAERFVFAFLLLCDLGGVGVDLLLGGVDSRTGELDGVALLVELSAEPVVMGVGVDRIADVGVVGKRQVEAVPPVIDVEGLLGVLEVERDGFGAAVRGSTVGGPSGEQPADVVGGDLLVVDSPRRRPG